MSVKPVPRTFTKKPGSAEQGVVIPCPLCHGTHFIVFHDCGEWSFVRCKCCGLVLQNPQPRREELLQRYDEEYFSYEEQNEAVFLDLALKGLHDIRFEQICGDMPDRSLLDIGCATGVLLNHFKQRGWSTAGVEVCAASARFGNERYGVGIFNGTIEQAPWPEGSFSVVLASHVIEHLNDPVGFVHQVSRLLKPGGLFFCATPDRSGFQAKIFGSRWRSAIADHLFLFRSKDLLRLFNREGFRLVRRKTWGGLGAGYAPDFIKRVMDRFVKWVGWGDVVLLAVRKPKS